MVMATFFFLALSVCIFAGLVCYSLANSIKMARVAHMPASEHERWEQIKMAILDLHSRYESTESPKQKALRSWAGTLVICAGLCMIGILLEVRYNSFISPKTVISGWFQPTEVGPCQWPSTPSHNAAPAKDVPSATKKL
jgi:hypothetical protein